MSIRMTAIELYRVMKEIGELEKKLNSLDLEAPERKDLERQLRQAQAGRDRIKAMLEGAKAG